MCSASSPGLGSSPGSSTAAGSSSVATTTVEMSDERRPTSDYRWARKVAALLLILVVVVLLVLDVIVDEHEVRPSVLVLLLLTDAGLPSVDVPRLKAMGAATIPTATTARATRKRLSGALPAIPEVGCQLGEFGRGERDSPFVTHVRPRPRLVLVNRTWTTPARGLVVARSA
jgi:hypothetical protein